MATSHNTDDPTRPDYVRPEVVAAEPDLCLIHDLLAGTRAVHAKPDTYIPKWPDEDSRIHLRRATMEQLYEGLTRTRSAAVGKMFAKPPVIAWGPQEATMKAHWDNIDLRGTKGDVAIKVFASDGVGDGLALILVDHPARPEGVAVTAANEASLNLRPFWAFYTRGAVLSWFVETINGAGVVTSLVLYEPAVERAGKYGVQTVERFRELAVEGGVARWRLWRKVEEKDGTVSFTLDAAGDFKNRDGKLRATLPIAAAYTGAKAGDFVAKPPLLPVAFANLGHYQQSANLRYYRELASFPVPTVIGDLVDDGNGNPGKLLLGPGRAQHIREGGDFKFAELAGTSLEQVEKGVAEKESQMAKLGLAFLQRDTRAAETAEAHRIDAAAEDSTLATAAQGIEDAVNLAWEHHAWFMGLTKADAPVVTLNRDYSGTVLSPQAVTAIAGLVNAGMPVETAVRTLVAGGAIVLKDPADLDVVVMEWQAGVADKEAREQEAAEDRARGLQEAA